MQYETDEKDNNNNNNNIKTVYNAIEPTIEDTLENQKLFLYNSVQKESKNSEIYWKKLIELDDYINKNEIINNSNDLRQDYIFSGILSDFNENDLYIIAPLIDDKNFDCFDIYNTKNYLSKCLLISQSLNTKFQNDIKYLFEKINKNAMFQSAPVKLESRC